MFANHIECDGQAETQKCFSCIYSRDFSRKTYFLLPKKHVKHMLFENNLLRKINNKANIDFFIKNISIFENKKVEIQVLSDWYKKVLFKNLKNAKVVDFSAFNNEIKILSKPIFQKKPAKDQKVKLLFVGRQNKAKGLEFLLEVFKSLNQDKYCLTIIGPEDSSFQISEDHMKKGNIVNKGSMDKNQLEKEYGLYDCLIVPSLDIEMKPLTVIEGIQNGLIIIGSDKGGIRDLLKKYSNGILFSTGNSTDLKYKIENRFQ